MFLPSARLLLFLRAAFCHRIVILGANWILDGQLTQIMPIKLAQIVKNLPAMQETQVQFPGKIPWRRK